MLLLQIPEAMEKVIPANINEGKTCPVFAECVEIEWYTVEKDESDIAQQAHAIDMSYLATQQNKETCPSWSAFNQSLSKQSAESAAITTVGYMPIYSGTSTQDRYTEHCSETLYVYIFATRTRIHSSHS